MVQDPFLMELVEYVYTHGVTHLFLDEVHRYPDWSQILKIYTIAIRIYILFMQVRLCWKSIIQRWIYPDGRPFM